MLDFRTKAPSARRYIPRPLSTTPIGSTARICKASSARSGLRSSSNSQLRITPDFKRYSNVWLDQRRYMVFHPGASVPKRSFTVQAAREVIEHVLKRNPDLRVVLTGSSPKESGLKKSGMESREKERIINAIGCSAQQIAAFIQSAQFFIGTDSGITHLACFLRASVIVAAHYGTTNWLPFYCPSAVVLYRLEEEVTVHQSREYLDAQRRGRIKPLGAVPTHAICAAIDRFVGCLGSEGETIQEVFWGERKQFL